MDEWIIVASSALRFFKFMQSITKKNTRQSTGHPEMARPAFKNKKSLQISGFGQNDTKSHLKQKNIFFAKSFKKEPFSHFYIHTSEYNDKSRLLSYKLKPWSRFL